MFSIRIKHTSIGLNYIDTYHRSGIYPLPSNLPVCPGMEAAGEVIEIGNNVQNFKIGDKVAYATPPIGAYCEIRDFPEEKLIAIPDFLQKDKTKSIGFLIAHGEVLPRAVSYTHLRAHETDS